MQFVDQIDTTGYDYIVIGAGSVGIVMEPRLAQTASNSVLLPFSGLIK